jgi:hypothetical protein
VALVASSSLPGMQEQLRVVDLSWRARRAHEWQCARAAEARVPRAMRRCACATGMSQFLPPREYTTRQERYKMSAPSSTPPNISPAPQATVSFVDDQGKLRFELYKSRVEEYRGRYESMRELEWKILFQMYAGYAAIGVVYEHLRKAGTPASSQGLLSLLAIGATVAFYAAARYLTYRIQERLIVFDAARIDYLRAMHESLAAAAIPLGSLGSTYYWTYHTQLILSTLACLALIGYAATQGLSASVPMFAMAATIALAVVSLRFGWKVYIKVPA